MKKALVLGIVLLAAALLLPATSNQDQRAYRRLRDDGPEAAAKDDVHRAVAGQQPDGQPHRRQGHDHGHEQEAHVHHQPQGQVLRGDGAAAGHVEAPAKEAAGMLSMMKVTVKVAPMARPRRSASGTAPATTWT